ncbi:MAG TPA: triose-phosphate isomerase [Myxococcales bacterium]|nr:triose-phosphate isomerase [Myxococcales bacterium]
MARKPVIAGNWKMFKTAGEAAAMLRELRPKVSMIHDVEIVVCPPFTALPAAAQALAGSNVALGAQNLHWEAQGAFTGEVSAGMLKDAGCSWVVVGHSERRQIFDETDERVHAKSVAALGAGLTPIICVGETLQEREEDETLEVVGGQIEGALRGLTAEQFRGVVVAYEPVWAIGTGKVATPAQAQEVHAAIRAQVGKLHGEEPAAKLRILYGGSVKPENIKELMAQPDLDGALVGGASLQADSFAAIVRYRG